MDSGLTLSLRIILKLANFVVQMFSVVIHCSVVPDQFLTALYYDAWEQISPLCVLNDRIMKFVCLYKAGVYGELVLLGDQCVIYVTLTLFWKQCIFFCQGYRGIREKRDKQFRNGP